MIRVKIDLLEYGDPKKVVPIGVMNIANDATGDERVGNYDVTFEQSSSNMIKTTRGRVEGFRRKRGVMPLIRAASESLGLDVE